MIYLGFLVFFLSGAAWSQEPVSLGSLIDDWNEEMVQSISPKNYNQPKSLRNPSPGNRIRNALFTQKVAGYVTVALAEQRNAGPNEDASNAAVRQKLLKQITQLSQSSTSFFYNGTYLEDFRDAVTNSSGVDAQVFDQSLSLQNYSERYRKTVEGDRKTYGAEFFSSAVVAKGAVDVLGTAFHALIRGDDLYNWSAMYAIGMLHPITDTVADRGDLPRSTAEKALKKLAGFNVIASTPLESLSFHYLSQIESAFPRGAHPKLYWILTELVKAQLSSALVRPTEEEAILKNAFKRGGLSTLAFMYIALGGLTENEIRSFYVGGGIYQLLDDLTDIGADLEEGIPSYWTQSIAKKGNIKMALKRFLSLEAAYEENFSHSPVLKEQMSAGVHVRGFNILLMLGITMNDNVPAVKASKSFAQKLLPISFNVVRRGVEALQILSENVQIPSDVPHVSTDYSSTDRFNQMAESAVIKSLYGSVTNRIDSMTFAERIKYLSPRLKGPIGRVIEMISRPFFFVADRGYYIPSDPASSRLLTLIGPSVTAAFLTAQFLEPSMLTEAKAIYALVGMMTWTVIDSMKLVFKDTTSLPSYWQLREAKNRTPLVDAIKVGVTTAVTTTCGMLLGGM